MQQYIYLQKFRCCVMQPLHSMTKIIGVTKVEIWCVQNRFHHLQVYGIILDLFLSQMQRRPSVRYYICRRDLEDVMSSYSPTHLSVCNNNEVTARQEAYCPYQSPYFSTTGSCWNLTSSANCKRKQRFIVNSSLST